MISISCKVEKYELNVMELPMENIELFRNFG